ncbi:acyl-CoA thioesterase [Hoyosella rhizosphaerae]|uniref:Thioesterase n=1 Tax=Hoyosella rhizosphaerae TaxID=1755582 RepID=A0A916UH93_9ACTN|nr:thioesterase family protein [Hoyosella rhizosphaerae]MBN4928124.1 acyl-CoA thioesterase [Hoyosella rhizosphaerae]GGC72562.1 thioesterase [Hoyosella rhizosphaerae]
MSDNAAPYSTTVEVRWGDSDMLGHVNNTKFIEYAQEARVRFVTEEFSEGFSPDRAIVVRRIEADFERPLFTNSGPLTVDLSVEHVGNSSFSIRHTMYDKGGNRAGSVDAVLVAFDTTTNASRPLSESERTALEKYRGK